MNDNVKNRLGMKRIEQFLGRAAAGEDLVVGFLGGSITQGSLASCEENNYASLVVKGLGERFSKSSFTCVNAGVGGTGSHYGSIRMQRDLMVYKPDLVVLDFSVNDIAAVLPLYGDGAVSAGDAPVNINDSNEPSDVKLYPETWEGVVRRILSAENLPALLALNNAFYDTGESVEDEHNAIADHYGVPHVSIRDTILKRIATGEFTREDVSPDGLHPNDKGHSLIAEELLGFLDGIDFENTSCDDEEAMPGAMTSNAFENMEKFDIFNCTPSLNGFRPDPVMKEGYRDFFRNGWEAKRIGDRLCLDTECGELAVVYRKTINRPAPVAELIVDGDRDGAITLDSNFDEDWGDCLYLQPVIYHKERQKHRIEIVITKASDLDRAPFYLLCFGVG